MAKSKKSNGQTATKQVELEYHPLANLFPLLGETEIQTLADDIRSNGLNVPITMYEGKILDGRNRHAACVLAGVTPVFVDYE
jgi:ParB-like chromosome segregation protein Spo0J